MIVRALVTHLREDERNVVNGERETRIMQQVHLLQARHEEGNSPCRHQWRAILIENSTKRHDSSACR